MTVGIFETEHFEVAYPMIRLFDNGENKITIYTNTATHRQLQYLLGPDTSRYEWIIQEAGESKYGFMRRMYKEVKRRHTDQLYLNTISHNFIVYACMIWLLKHTQVVVTLHAINNYFQFKPAFNLRRWVRHIGKRALIRITHHFNVISDTMVSYLQSKLPAHKQVFSLPGAVFEEQHFQFTAPSFTERINLVVPGSVDARRRDYSIVLELLQQGRHLPLNIVLLGPFADPYGNDIREKCLQYAATHSNLLFYDRTVVDQPEFDRVMHEAHFILAPSVIETVLVDDIPETYGQSICSGNIADVIKYARPFITPHTLTIPFYLISSAIFYKNVADIIQELESLHQYPGSYNSWLQQAVHNSRKYTIENVRAHPSLN